MNITNLKNTKMRKPSKELEMEVLGELLESNTDHNHKKGLEMWEKNPWLMVSMYEVTFFPSNLMLPLVTPKGVTDINDKEFDKRVKEFLDGDYFEESPRAPKGVYNIDGVEVEINRFGRIVDPMKFYDEETE